MVGKKGSLETFLYRHKHSDDEIARMKTLVVIGGTGTGKTTLLNAYVNFLMGIDKKDTFRYVLIDETKIIAGKKKGESVTDDVIIYEIEGTSNCPPLKIVDTPGFGDTRGPKHDIVISEKIATLFKTELNTVTAICYVAKFNCTRLGDMEKYILTRIV